jgi:hypothetical protein
MVTVVDLDTGESHIPDDDGTPVCGGYLSRDDLRPSQFSQVDCEACKAEPT